MILADTSVWVNHIRQDNPHLSQCLKDRRIMMHPFVVGEIACGNLPSRSRVLADLRKLHFAICAETDEVLHLLEEHHLFGKGINWIDAHLLASARLSGCRLWTLDKPLHSAATAIKVGYSALL